MKKILKVIGSILVLLIVGIGIIYFFFPQKIVDFTYSQNASAAKLTAETITVNGYNTHYYTNNNTTAKDTLVLLHGLGDDKNSFVQSAAFLTNDYYLIIPDLLASGENEKDNTSDLSIKGQVDFLNQFLTNLKVENFSLAGNSMGGHVAAAYAIAYPKKVNALVLLNAPGLTLDDHVVYSGFGSVLKDETDLNAVLSRVFYKVPDLPGPIKKMYISQINESRDFLNNNIIPQIKNGQYFDLKNNINQIKAPTLILWGKHDAVVKFNVAERYKRDIPLSEIEIIENASHSPQLEVPEVVATSINSFIQNKSKQMKAAAPTTREQHLAKVQLHRWYQLYEREMNEKRINNQLDILDDAIYMKSAAGEMKGKANYPERLTAYKGWQNAHHVEHVNVTTIEDGLKLEADIRYQNIRPDGEKKSYTIHYNTKLINGEDYLPKFSSIEITPTGETNDNFEDAYGTNRVKSLMYYWIASMENLDGDVSPFKEVLADGFVLNFSTQSRMTSIKELETWLKGTPIQLSNSEHYPKHFEVKQIIENEFEMKVEFYWKGQSKDGKKLEATTQHTWYVLDNPNDRFAKILKVDVVQTVPLKVLE
ncbi:alpha/beta fold hydrolase [Lacinutrix mariniflava]|uniref:alpha/beta fold hydrolase n=1 Tax=Lacinutrix mariniflava TaxID=342955 RepID=UPI0006E17BE7|nr:alpha/beta hydrolase [Lacinutrix mariniflava]